jgi:uncharacterized protein (DUF2147 family)
MGIALMIISLMHSGNRLVSLAVWLMLFAVSGTFYELSTAVAADTPQSVWKIGEQRLLGHWLRPDGGYILELKEVGKDGTLKAAYFNPRPINVARADWKRKQSVITVFVELRDVNYPGSKYNLEYDPKTDRLKGTYFQAIQRQTFDVEFVRAK